MHGVITSMEQSRLESMGEDTNSDCKVFSFSVTAESEGLLGVGLIGTPSSKLSFISPEIVKKDGGTVVVMDVILSNTDLDGPRCLDDRAFDIGRGVSRNICLPLSIVQSARHDTRGEGEIKESNLLCSGLSGALLSTSLVEDTILLAPVCPS